MSNKKYAKLIAGTLSAAMVVAQMPASTVASAKELGITAIGKQTELVMDRYTSSGVESTLYSKDGGDIQSLADAAIAENLSLTGTGTTTGGSESNIAPGSAYSVATAFDPDGDGVADWMARVSLEDEEKGGRVLLSVSMAAAGDGSGKPYVAFLNEDTGGYVDTTEDIAARAVEGLINIAAGDFDGDGMEELAVYAPNNSDEVETQVVDAEGNYPKNQLSLKIYDMDFNLDISNYWNFHVKTSIPEPTKVIEAGEGTTRWNYSSTDATTGDKNFYNIPYLSLMAEDVDGDGIDDLTTVANFSRLKDGYYRSAGLLTLAQVEESLFSADYCLASVMDIYTGSKSVSEFMTQTLKKKVLMGYDAAANKMFAVRNTTVALGSVSDSNSREIMIAGNYSAAYDPSNTNTVNFGIAASRALSVYTEKNGFIWGTGIDIVRPYVVLGCFTYEELVGKEIKSFETLKNWDWTYTESGYDRLRFENTMTAEGMEIEPVAMVPFAAHGTDESDSVFLEGQIYRYNTETKEFEDTGYAPAYPTNYYSSEGVWIGSAVASNVTGSTDGAETVYYTYYEEDAAGTANYCSIVGLWGEETEDSKNYNSTVKSYSTTAFPMHVTLALAEKAVEADTTTAQIAFAEGELEEDGTILLTEEGCTPKVIVTYGNKQLRPGKDYYVTYTDNTEAGFASAIITAMGDYTGTGTLSFEIVEAEEEEGEVTYEVESIEAIDASNRTWDSYVSYYYYNQLDEAGKAFWNQLDAACKELLTTTKDAGALVDGEGNKTYVTGAAKTNQLSGLKVKKIVSKFLYSNPQYYFLTNLGSMTPNANVVAGTDISYSLEVDASFAEGEARQTATTQIEEKLAEYYEEIDACSTDEEKVRTIHDLMLENIDYASGGTTIYEALLQGEAQCEGYTELFQLLAAGAGISSIIVADIDTYCHAWNMVKLNGSWYVVDVTWDDPVDGDGSLYYLFYLVSDEEHQSLNQYADSWCSPVPEATLSSGSTQDTAGTVPSAKGYTSTSKITAATTSGGILVTLKAKSTETIYYTLDGSTPGQTRGASEIYAEPLMITEPCVIKSVAVRDGYIDDKVSVQTIKGIQFNGNSCDEGKVSSILYGSDTQVTISENSYVKTGYRFTGWNTFSDGTGDAYEAGEVVDVEGLDDILVLYAQWEEEEYSITYELAGGTNDSSNPDSYKMSDDTITLAEPEQTGYYFDGWYTDAEYADESKVTAISGGSTGDVTLYAKWTPYIYHVSFKANGGEGTMDKVKNCEFGTTYTFPANTFTREGYTFVGWCDRSDGSTTIYEDQGEFCDLYAHDNITIVMFAIWQENGAEETPGVSPSAAPGDTPSTAPDATPSTKPGDTPSAAPDTTPSTAPGTSPSAKPSALPSAKPGAQPSASPSAKPDAGSNTKPGDTSEITVGKVKLKSVKNVAGKKLVVKYKKLADVDGYEISYTTDKKMKKAVKVKTTTKAQYTIKKLKKNKKYFVRVRAYKLDSTGEKVYGSYSNKKNVVVKK